MKLLRDGINSAMIENSKVLKKLTKLECVLEWMKENNYIIPRNLEQEISIYKEKVNSTSKRLNRAINLFDRYKKVI